MKVVAAINGLITSEVAALYAMRYARLHGFTLTVIHVLNQDDRRDEVERSMDVIEEAAAASEIRMERVFLEGEPVEATSALLADIKADTVFCSARMRGRFFAHSFSEALSRRVLPADLAVVRVVHVGGTSHAELVLLPIREDRLSVKKFTFFAEMARAYEAGGEIYSVTVVGRRKLAELELATTRGLLETINARLAHYVKLSRAMAMPLRIKHAIALNEVDQILHHLAHHDFQLMVVGGERLAGFRRWFGEPPIERLFRYTPVNTIAYYPREPG